MSKKEEPMVAVEIVHGHVFHAAPGEDVATLYGPGATLTVSKSDAVLLARAGAVKAVAPAPAPAAPPPAAPPAPQKA